MPGDFVLLRNPPGSLLNRIRRSTGDLSMPQPGTIWRTIRHANGAWQPAFVELEPLEASDPGQFHGDRRRAITDELELAAVSQFIQIWQTTRHHDGT